jgi:hypothetical protein
MNTPEFKEEWGSIAQQEITEGLIESDRLQVIIPECCREGWDTCPHVVKRDDRPKRNNIGL